MRKYFLLISDLQTKILPYIKNSNSIINNTNLLIESTQYLPNINKVYCAQILPEKLGFITPKLKLNPNVTILTKNKYSLYSPNILTDIKKNNIDNIILTGVETPWCIAQTTIDFLKQDINVHIPIDAVGCQNEKENDIALTRLQSFGAHIGTTKGILAECIPDVTDDSAKWFVKKYNSDYRNRVTKEYI